MSRPRPLEIAFVMPGVGVETRGAEAFVVELASALAARPGFDVTLYCRRPQRGLPFAQHQLRGVIGREAGVVRRLYGASRLGRKLLDHCFLDPLNLEWASAALAAFPDLWRRDHDVVVMEGGLVGSWLCRLRRRLRRRPFVDVAHGLSAKWEGAFARQRPDRVVVFTRAAAALIGELAPRAQIEVIPHGVDLAQFSPIGEVAPVELERPLVLTVGALDAHKQLELAIDALAELGRGSLLVLGDGPAAEYLDQRAARLLGERRYLRRRVARSDMPTYYRAADLFTLPSRSEAFGLVYLEAMACGRACVAPDDAVRREVIAGAGLYCDPHDREGYATTLARALDRDWRGLPRARAEELDLATTVERYAALFEEIAQ